MFNDADKSSLGTGGDVCVGGGGGGGGGLAWLLKKCVLKIYL